MLILSAWKAFSKRLLRVLFPYFSYLFEIKPNLLTKKYFMWFFVDLYDVWWFVVICWMERFYSDSDFLLVKSIITSFLIFFAQYVCHSILPFDIRLFGKILEMRHANSMFAFLVYFPQKNCRIILKLYRKVDNNNGFNRKSISFGFAGVWIMKFITLFY